jgi:polyisoprenoid-binding protein YceI
MKSLIIAATAIAAVLPARAQTQSYTLDPDHTFPAFEIGHLGYSIQRGRFNRTAGRITLDSAAKTGSAEITIDAASISTGHPKLEEHLRSEDFFDVAKYPEIVFRAKEFSFQGDKVAAVKGELTMHGATQPVTLKAEYFNCADHPMTRKRVCGADFSATVKRGDFGIKTGIPLVADEVKLRINVEAIKD